MIKKEKNDKNKNKKTLFKSVLHFNSVHIQYVDASIVTWQAEDQSSQLGSQVISLHIYVQFRSITVKHRH